jgi:hypothetical protein
MNLIFIKNKESKTTKEVIIESLKSLSEDKRSDNYMFFQNIKTICDAAKDIMEMDKDTVDEILSNGHDWASDHIATSKDDVEEVYNFLKNKI